MKIYISHASSYDYEDQLYRPVLEKLTNQEIFLPHQKGNEDKKAETVLPEMDALIADVSFPSTGQGIEIGTAYMLNKPILCLYKRGAAPSTSLTFVTEHIVAYENSDDMIKKIQDFLGSKTAQL